MSTLLGLVPLGVWAALWTAGGGLLAGGLFRLRRGEGALLGLGIGLVTETWLTNALAHWLPLVAAIWIATGLTCLGGLLALLMAKRAGRRIDLSVPAGPWLILLALTLLFISIGRGLAIFEDYQNLPTISLMATGDVPPHFALDPQFLFNYHYLLLLFAAQVMRLGHLSPWTALDASRGLVIALPLVLAGLWALRLTRDRLAAFLTGSLLFFAGGARWLLLLLPQSLLLFISGQITLIGSGAVTAPDLFHAMLSSWKIDGDGPLPFPFAFHSGIFQSYVMTGYTGYSGLPFIIVLLLLLTAERWRTRWAGVVASILLAALALANEVVFGLVVLGFGLAAVIWLISRRTWKLPANLLRWLAVLLPAGVAALVQGGLFTEIVRARLFPAPGGAYFNATPDLVWPPALISAHFGSLSIFNPAQLLVALTEIGPILLVVPILLVWGWKTLRVQRWYEAALIGTLAGSLPALFVAFQGPLFTATPRLLDGLLFACTLYGVPLLWIWLKGQNDRVRSLVAAVGLITIFPGLMLFGIQLISIQKPVYSSFINQLDAQVMGRYWDQLKPGSLVLDPEQYQAPTIFGRPTDSSVTWYVTKPGWQALLDDPDPHQIHAAGYDYFYFGLDYWSRLSPQAQAALQQSCVRKIYEVVGIHSESDYRKDFRRLLDVSACG